MKKVIIGTVAMVAVAGLGFGGWWYYKNNISDYKYIISCQNEIKKTLKDPFSVKWGEGIILQKNDTNIEISQPYHAKNSYGAYGGETNYCEIQGNMVEVFTQKEKEKNEKIKAETKILEGFKKEFDELYKKAGELGVKDLELGVMKNQVQSAKMEDLNVAITGQLIYMKNLGYNKDQVDAVEKALKVLQKMIYQQENIKNLQ